MILGLQIGIFLAYIAFVWAKYGVLNSISESWYKVEDKEKILFTLFCFSLGILTLFYAGGPLWFLSGACLTFVGAATRFKDGKYTQVIHTGGALLSILIAFIALWIEGIWFGPFLTAGTWLSFKLFKWKNKTWWVEVVAFACIMVSIYLQQHNII